MDSIGLTCMLEFQWVLDKRVCYILHTGYVDEAEFGE